LANAGDAGVEHALGPVAGLGAHGVGDADELAEILAVDDGEQHQRAAGAQHAVGGKAHRPVAGGRLVDQHQEFSRIVMLRHGGIFPPRRRLNKAQRKKPTMARTSAMVFSAMALARAAPSAMKASMLAGSATSRRVSAAMGASCATASSASAGLKAPQPLPPNSASTAARLVSARAA